jgi:TnpA family transposase
MLKALMSDGDHAKVQMQRYYGKKAASIKLCDSRYPALGSKTFSLLNIAITTWET